MSKTKIILVLIILLASFLRLWKINEVPISLFGDEVDVGYQAYSLLKTHKDYMGQPLPLYIHSLSEWRAPLFIYSTIPFIALFGLNEWGVRLAPAFFGILGVYLVYLFGKGIKNEQFGLISAALLAILPWHIHYSRAAFEVTLLLNLVLLGVIFFRDRKYLASGLFFALTPYTYSTAVVFTPFFVLRLFFFDKQKIIYLKNFFLPVILLGIPFIYLYFFGMSASRFSLLSIFNSERMLDQINIERSESNNPFERIFHNKLVGWSKAFATNYAKSFSPEFNFINGDLLPRHNVPENGEFFWGYLPLLLAGLIYLIKSQEKYRWLIFCWLFLASIPASLTNDGGNHATRLFLRIPPLIFISAYGAMWLSNKKIRWNRVLLALTIVFLSLNLIWWLHRYLVHYPYQQWKYWHYGYKEAMLAVGDNKNNYSRLFINNTHEPALLHFLFWNRVDPAEFQAKFMGDVPKDGIIAGFNGFQFDKYYFGETAKLLDFLQPGDLYLASQGKEIPGDWDFAKSPPDGIKVIKVIRDPQNKPLFTLVAK